MLDKYLLIPSGLNSRSLTARLLAQTKPYTYLVLIFLISIQYCSNLSFDGV